MRQVPLSAIITLIIAVQVLSLQGQDSITPYELRVKADSALSAKNYSLSSSYYDKFFLLLKQQSSSVGPIAYYNASCAYSLNKEKVKALEHLELSFKISNASDHSNPVNGAHILSDADLDYIRDDVQFVALLKKYYPTMPIDIVTAQRITYSELLTLINYMGEQFPALPRIK